MEIASAAGALDPDEDPFAVFAPRASVPQEQPPAPPVAADGAKCRDCPHPAHIGAACTKKRGRGACRCGVPAASAVEQARCEPGCEEDHGARPRLVENVTQAHESASIAGNHLPVCVQDDAGKWLCMEGCTAAGGGDGVTLTAANPGKAPDVLTGLKAPETARASGAAPNPSSNFQRDQPSVTGGAAEQRAEEDSYSHLPPGVAELARVQDEQKRSRGWTGTLQVNVNLGPETLALLQWLLGAKS